METAYVLINCDLGSEKELINEIKNIKNVKEVHGIFGAYDIIATVESKTPEKIRQTVIGQIRDLDHIRSTLTLMGIEDVEQKMKAELIPDIIPKEKKPLERPTGIDDDEEFEDDYDDEYDDEEEFSSKKK